MKKGIENALLLAGGMLLGSGLTTAYQDYKKRSAEEPVDDDFEDEFDEEFDGDLELDDEESETPSVEETESSEEDQ